MIETLTKERFNFIQYWTWKFDRKGLKTQGQSSAMLNIKPWE